MNSFSKIPEWQHTLLRFLRDDIPLSDFEQWVYSTEDLKSLLNSDLYLHLLEANYQDKLQVYELRQRLSTWLHNKFPQTCDCLWWKDDQVIPLGFETRTDIFMEKFTRLKRQTPWIDLVRCKSCGQSWYLAIDTIDDDYHFQRLAADDVEKIEKGYWPTFFDNLDAVWPSQEWLEMNGFKSLSDWQTKNRA